MIIDIKSFGDRYLWKGLLTGFLIIVLLIPALLVQNLVEERRQRHEEVIAEVSSKWANPQILKGPFLIIPYTYTMATKDDNLETFLRQRIVLPQDLNLEGQLQPEKKRRTIYEVALYRSDLRIEGNFDLASVQAAPEETIHWDKARLCLGISDVRGIEKQIGGSLLNQPLQFEAGIPENAFTAAGVSAALDLSSAKENNAIVFTIPLSLRGSGSFQLLPVGKTTVMNLGSPWQAPSFDGKFLPDHKLSDSGFSASWKVLHFNRNFPQVWVNQDYAAEDYAFGVSLLQPTDNYSKTLRSVKYAILFIGLTFGFFFLLEILQNKKVHPIQYILVGVALVVFYTLLLSVGEVSGFDLAYIAATIATVGLITWYSKFLFSSWRNALFIGAFLTTLYTFIYVLIQLEDSALLLGSIGLFVLIAIAMHFSKKISWYEPGQAAALQ